jgi:hypothetical protein
MGHEKRRHSRFKVAIPVRFNLDPKHHLVPRIRKTGVRGTLRDLSPEGFRIESGMDLLDVCQIFPEAIGDDSVFGLELEFSDSQYGRIPTRGEVRWYRVGELRGNLRDFQAGLRLMDIDSRLVARRMVETISRTAEPSGDYEGFLDLRGFRMAEGKILGAIRNTGDRTAKHLVIDTKFLDPRGEVVCRRLYRTVPYGRTEKHLRPGATLRVAAKDPRIPPSAATVRVSVQRLSLD